MGKIEGLIEKLNSNKKIKPLLQFIKFGIIGVIATLIDYSVLIILREAFYVDVFIASTISFFVSLIFNYMANMKYVFINKKESMNKTRTIIAFILTSLVGLMINQLVMYILINDFYIHYILSKFFATIIVFMWNFFSKKLLIEKKN